MAADQQQPRQSLRWSGSFRVAHSAGVATQHLQGDKMLLSPSVLGQLLANAPRTTAPSSHHAFTAFDPANPYSVAAAQRERALFTESHRQLPHPLMFRLANQKNGNAVYAGIREFSADEGEVALSPYLMEALGIEEKVLAMPHRGAKKGAGGGTDSGVIDLTGDDEPGHRGADMSGGVHITVKAQQLPKGTFVRLRPLESGYDPDDWKSLLERQLHASSFTTLSKGAILSIRDVKGGEEFRFLVDEFRPEGDGICVVDTDLEVDIEPLNEEQARETMRKIAGKAQRAPGTGDGSSVGHPIDIWKGVEGQVLAGDYVDYELPAWDRSRAIAFELDILSEGDEVDLLVSPRSSRQRATPRESEYIFADFSSPPDGRKRIVIQPTNAELDGAESLLVSVHGFSLSAQETADSLPTRYVLRAKAVDSPGSTLDVPLDLASSSPAPLPPSADREQCQNCRQWVPKRTMVLHENFCYRNNIASPHCSQVFHKSSAQWASHWHCPAHPEAHGSTVLSKAKHDHLQHAPHTCPACGPASPFTFPSLAELARHRTTVCPHRLILCRFCHLECPQEGDPSDPSAEAETVLTGLTAHERADGGRTTECHLCGAIVRLREAAAHAANHALDRAARPTPAVCRDALCGRTLFGAGPRGRVGESGAGDNGGGGQGPGNNLGLCSLCFSPLYAAMHDPEGKALRRRVERRYLTQVMKGCGKAWCENGRWCRTGRTNLEKDGKQQKKKKVDDDDDDDDDEPGPPLPTGAAGALPLVKPLVEDVGDQAKAMHFCVDEVSQRRRGIAEMMAAEGAFELGWCVAALEAEGGDLDRARGWLGDWAARKGRI